VFTECGLSSSESRTLIGKEFHARGPATEKACTISALIYFLVYRSTKNLTPDVKQYRG